MTGAMVQWLSIVLRREQSCLEDEIAFVFSLR